MDSEFWVKLYRLIKIVFPKRFSQQHLIMIILSACLVLRTWMSIRLAEIQGKVVKAIIKKDFTKFL